MLIRELLRRLIVVFLALAAAPQLLAEPEKLFTGAPRDKEGRFTNIDGEISHGSIAVRAPFMLRRFGTGFRKSDGAPEITENDGAFVRETAGQDTPTLTWIGHATVLVQMEQVTFLTDPIWAKRPSPVSFFGPKRYVKPGIKMEDLPAIDFVIISHNHYDHLDLPTLVRLAKRNVETIFFVPLGNAKLLRKHGIDKVQELDWGDTVNYKSALIHCLPSQHWSKRSLSDERKTLWSSWAVTGVERRFYFAGDTGYFSGFKEIGEKLGPFDLVAVPIGAYEPVAMMRASHMNPEEAVQASLDLRTRRVVAIHFGTFDLSDEPVAEPPLRFKKAATNTELGEPNSWVLNIGETREF
jgi:N-acyl-phosphatidylethanolamine-hydrolysing phospholipase D